MHIPGERRRHEGSTALLGAPSRKFRIPREARKEEISGNGAHGRVLRAGKPTLEKPPRPSRREMTSPCRRVWRVRRGVPQKWGY
ncbi:hypothetical protein HMPREF9440_01470 [Sutterella parvirubra YIT 11816]|uniref:Uncharacterized protein n=1 Tax=Sutterella parvirubra YIT 11816 TaxID=762967 RepID=H3KFF3_9BURK|nr:hypothetical protein HMPREF9440_01470 [Sutterella parvirubra YIT 11816]